jgi:hypothetical protein
VTLRALAATAPTVTPMIAVTAMTPMTAMRLLPRSCLASLTAMRGIMRMVHSWCRFVD